MSDENRRERDRHTVWFPVHVDADDAGQRVAISKDVSETGMLVASAAKLVVGAPVTIKFQVAPVDETPREIQGTIVRITDNDEDPRGNWPYKMAVEFDESAPELEQLLREAARFKPQM